MIKMKTKICYNKTCYYYLGPNESSQVQLNNKKIKETNNAF